MGELRGFQQQARSHTSNASLPQQLSEVRLESLEAVSTAHAHAGYLRPTARLHCTSLSKDEAPPVLPNVRGSACAFEYRVG